MDAEDQLLETGTAWNTHRVSNLYERSGYVYVLRESRPWTTETKIALGVAATLLLGAVMALRPRMK